MGTSQLAFSFPEPKRRGGARRGAGRKPRVAHLRQTPHRARAVHRKAHPVHVTLRAGLRSLRSQQVARTLLGGLRDSNRDWFRIVHYSVQDNHVHLIVESESSESLSSGIRGLNGARRAARESLATSPRALLGRSLARSRFGGPAASAQCTGLRAAKSQEARA